MKSEAGAGEGAEWRLHVQGGPDGLVEHLPQVHAVSQPLSYRGHVENPRWPAWVLRFAGPHPVGAWSRLSQYPPDAV